MSKKAEGKVTVASVNGLHVRPASQIVKKAKEFEADVTFKVGEGKASAKSLFKLQTLEMNHGTEIHIHAEGMDAEDAVKALEQLIKEIKE